MINPELIKPLPKRKIKYTDFYLENYSSNIEVIERVLFFNPKKIYKRIGDKINPNKRHQSIQMDELFPKLDGKCACGCKLIPQSGQGWQRKWATDSCGQFAGAVLSIINNYFGKPAYYISFYAGTQCSECPSTTGLELDHIVSVKHGGGGCWLSNYRWLCKKCHNNKTKKDFNWGEYKPAEIINKDQISLNLQ